MAPSQINTCLILANFRINCLYLAMKSTHPAYLTLLAQYQQLFKIAREMGVRSTAITSTRYNSSSSDIRNFRLKEPFTINHLDLYTRCTSAEWCLVGQIMTELHENNALWKCGPDFKKSSSAKRRALQGLISKGILVPTETVHFFLVSPFYIRRGGPFEVLTTTANMLMGRKPNDTMLCDKRPVTHFDFSLAGLPDTTTT
jgi:hypothetical protein